MKSNVNLLKIKEMKIFLKHSSILLIVCGMFAACSDINHQHDKYLKDGEIIYLGRFDSIKVISGIERAEFVYWLSDPKGKNVEVNWNLGTKTRRFPVHLTTPNNPGKFVIEPLEEGTTSFDIIVYDANFQKRSILQNLTAPVFGSTYFESLNNRTLLSFQYNREYPQTSLVMRWVASVYPLNFGTEITYTTTAGVHVDTIARPGVNFDNRTVLQNVVEGSDFSYRVLYRLSADSELEFSSAVATLRVQPNTNPYRVLRDHWTVPGYLAGSADGTIGYSSQSIAESPVPNGRVMAMFNGITSQFWHSRHTPTPPEVYPHWFIVDMRANVTVNELELLRRINNSNTFTGFRLFTCPDVSVDQTDPVNGYPWEDQGDFAFDPFEPAPQRIEIPGAPVARYVKMYFGAEHMGTSVNAMLSEFSVWSRW